uniref:Uncharacterized protein n=1 Tax=Phaeomonas parva TaxID=124430 RepID=A0A7S1U7T0_9STRA|mmetsp:Transcript_35658/g.112059  ORF Transcript_35658/g.112059 Transcript_35658/m.112059 type:complete len:618 (+) Transcript_35658:312-2165(+)|eukprot:CAMPEP_0118859608 /NCGR_PEP_ID=MMETSP1163-20130328/5785_1 /TAXON_ID=124430 /ORGANISM="Phaeomonas parva, Strain CCMP2877" /LENGTH=617 /DNA_ID=CAMNT_0006793223 /DNA_START=239 /DNA_END=2092 /DNA_ORIENTATION=-
MWIRGGRNKNKKKDEGKSLLRRRSSKQAQGSESPSPERSPVASESGALSAKDAEVVPQERLSDGAGEQSTDSEYEAAMLTPIDSGATTPVKPPTETGDRSPATDTETPLRDTQEQKKHRIQALSSMSSNFGEAGLEVEGAKTMQFMSKTSVHDDDISEITSPSDGGSVTLEHTKDDLGMPNSYEDKDGAKDGEGGYIRRSQDERHETLLHLSHIPKDDCFVFNTANLSEYIEKTPEGELSTPTPAVRPDGATPASATSKLATSFKIATPRSLRRAKKEPPTLLPTSGTATNEEANATKDAKPSAVTEHVTPKTGEAAPKLTRPKPRPSRAFKPTPSRPTPVAEPPKIVPVRRKSMSLDAASPEKGRSPATASPSPPQGARPPRMQRGQSLDRSTRAQSIAFEDHFTSMLRRLSAADSQNPMECRLVVQVSDDDPTTFTDRRGRVYKLQPGTVEDKDAPATNKIRRPPVPQGGASPARSEQGTPEIRNGAGMEGLEVTPATSTNGSESGHITGDDDETVVEDFEWINEFWDVPASALRVKVKVRKSEVGVPSMKGPQGAHQAGAQPRIVVRRRFQQKEAALPAMKTHVGAHDGRTMPPNLEQFLFSDAHLPHISLFVD